MRGNKELGLKADGRLSWCELEKLDATINQTNDDQEETKEYVLIEALIEEEKKPRMKSDIKVPEYSINTESDSDFIGINMEFNQPKRRRFSSSITEKAIKNTFASIEEKAARLN